MSGFKGIIWFAGTFWFYFQDNIRSKGARCRIPYLQGTSQVIVKILFFCNQGNIRSSGFASISSTALIAYPMTSHRRRHRCRRTNNILRPQRPKPTKPPKPTVQPVYASCTSQECGYTYQSPAAHMVGATSLVQEYGFLGNNMYL